MHGSGHVHMSCPKMLKGSWNRMEMRVDPLYGGMDNGGISGSANDGYMPCL